MDESPKPQNILIVDDETAVLQSLTAQLASRDFAVKTARGGPEALEVAERQGPFAIVLAASRLPGMSGVELLTRLKEASPGTVRILVAAALEREVAVEAVNKAQVFRILGKPATPAELQAVMKDAKQHYDLLQAEKALLQQTINGEIQVLTEILSRVSPASFGRAQTVRQGMRQIASYFDVLDTWELEVAAMLARVGEIAMPPSLLAKVQSQAELSREDRDTWNKVPEIGSKLLSHIPRLQGIARDVLYQSKNFDGTGLPGDLVAQKAIPLGARLLKGLTDFQTALANGAKPPGALTQLKFYGTSYDPEVVSAIERGIVEAKANAAAGISRMATKLRDVRAGQRLAEPVLTLDEMLIFQRGLVITESMLDRMRNFDNQIGLRQPIYVEDSRVAMPPL